MRRRNGQRWVRLTAVLLTLVTAVALLLIGLGVFVPRPVGVAQQRLDDVRLTIPANGHIETALPVTVPPEFSLRGTAVWQSGEADVLVGVRLHQADDTVDVLLSPLGYVGVVDAMPVQPWFWVRRGAAPNELWLDVAGGEVTVWLNRERLWAGSVPGVTAVSLVGESFGKTAVVRFAELVFYWP